MNQGEAVEAVKALFQLSELLGLACKAYLYAIEKLRRRWWVRPVNLLRDIEGFQQTGTKQLMLSDGEHFFKATRLDPKNFQTLLVLLRERLSRNSRRAIAPEQRLAITLLYLAQGCNMQVLAWTHKIGLSTVRKIVAETCEAMWNELHRVYVAPPNITDWGRNANAFYIKTGMPNCLGAIDGKHIRIINPKKGGSLYFNYKRYFSVVLMAACDANYCFTFVDVGGVGSQSDGGIFLRSTFGRQILNGTLPVPPDQRLPGSPIWFPHYFVADSAFPLKENIMRPYPGTNLHADKQNFNKMLSKARVHIENAFGILSSRWQVLRTPIHAKPENVNKIVLATIVLHNFLMLQKDVSYFDGEVPERFGSETCQRVRLPTSNRSTLRAFQLRDLLKDYLYQNRDT